jgi:peptidoglycan-associated lipoprotein
MRILYLIPMVAAFGCAHHQQEVTAGSEQSAMYEQGQAGAVEKGTVAEAQPAQVAPEKVEAPKTITKSTCSLIRVHFNTDSADILDQDKASLEKSAACLKDNRSLRVSVEGNTDERGSDAYNLQLGEKRAQAVSEFLESQGVSKDQLKTISFGKEKPNCTENTESCWKVNRRVAIRPACRL